MSDEEFLAFLYRLQMRGLPGLECAVVCARRDYKWGRATTEEKWEQLHHHLGGFIAYLNNGLPSQARAYLDLRFAGERSE